ncbi:hypothetical protein IQ268_30275 [Oculatella sp. LEGE 06141]|uniref:hypothetical protein n=1 Tax=Oculatella sp. LEGE 06141 TaxID=1828648 RepID=UPI0018818CF5|nr:hypothetical protein [Oculatella sp. LEGE 06141]MBE9182827.1 hypothetical protein [Oculatella sp. LEGE 06141]
MPSSASSQPLAATTSKALTDPKLLDQLTERVYTLLQEEIRQQHELSHYRSGRGL